MYANLLIGVVREFSVLSTSSQKKHVERKLRKKMNGSEKLISNEHRRHE